MFGTLVNTCVVLVGGFVGSRLRGGIPERFQKTIMQGLSLCVLLIGMRGALATQDIFAVILCTAIGGAIGELLRIEQRLEALGLWVQTRFARGESRFAEGFVTASLVYCVGAMAVVGALESGLSGNHTTLLAKSALDGISAVLFSATLGVGVMMAAVPVLVYQGSIVLLAGFLKPLLSPAVIAEMSAVGGLLIFAIGLNLLGVAKIRVGNLLPGILLPIAYVPLAAWVASLF